MPGRLAASGAAGHLGEQLEGALGGAEIGHAEADIGGDDADQGDVGNVVALGDHLRADQHVVVAFAEILQDGFVLALAGDGVAIEARDARGGKARCSSSSTRLAADAEEVDVLAIALGALARAPSRRSRSSGRAGGGRACGR